MSAMVAQYLSFLLPLASVVSAQTCTSLTIPVSINTQVPHLTVAEPVNQAALTGFFTSFATPSVDFTSAIINGTHQVKQTYKIAGKLCTPKNVKSNGILEFATHGIAFDHSYWEVGGANSKYNFAESAVASGHSIFYYDRLGNGASSKPDGIQEVQSGVQIEITHELVQYIRQGKLGHKFGKIIGVGHSFGSILSGAITAKYPKDFDDVVLTGFATGNVVGLYIGTGSFGATIASESIPTLKLPPSYVVPGTPSAYQFGFLNYPFYDPAVAADQFKIRGTTTLGEFATLVAPIGVSPNFTSRVLVVTGSADSFFCAGNCHQTVNGTNLLDLVTELYPVASNFSSFLVENAGHGLTLHFSAPATYDVIQKWVGS
ncbi:hypothetical protein SISNIDRAFT_456374 [Sistotremastrum niveocremeum HHB9708]|uniref:AB hydrolase-1 domain-containing protein n=1 Tax=Sistotremastrum niveocremeum HHB9708 TaxID=1314777 RepID=A0A164STN7_9AGAM|nr:hypothetical protein SISNIDRAFT_456374 [Sistotremastrum niveocremeum HHB9708]